MAAVVAETNHRCYHHYRGAYPAFVLAVAVAAAAAETVVVVAGAKRLVIPCAMGVPACRE